jgi:isopentenyl-diphosphate delta-isomerase
MSVPHMIPAWVEGVLTPVEKLDAHRRGLRHPAISVFVNGGGRTLLQRRALDKYHTPGLWANACCTHPFWGEDMASCAERRLAEELGLRLPLVPRGQIEYRADVGGGLIEHEMVSLFVAEACPETLAIAPNPAEVAQTAWVDIDALPAMIEADPASYTPWLRIYLKQRSAPIFDVV